MKQPTMESKRWEDMDMDCLSNIFGRLSVDDLAVGVPFVCRSWYKASLDPLCWRVLDFRSLDFMPWSDLTKRFITHYSPSGRFSFSGFLRFAVRRSSGITVDLRFPQIFAAPLEDLIFASNECPRLETLVLPNLMLEHEVHIPELITKWKDLQLLELGSKPSSFFEMATQISLNCTNFTALKTHGAIKEEDAATLVKLLPNLRCLDLDKSYLPKQQLMVILKGCKELERLSVRNCMGFEADDEIVKKASRIETFEHEGSKLMDDYWYDTDDECDYVQVIC